MRAFLTNLPKNILIFLISGFRPLLGPATCRYPIGCTQFALEQLQSKPLVLAFCSIAKRVLSCFPWPKILR